AEAELQAGQVPGSEGLIAASKVGKAWSLSYRGFFDAACEQAAAAIVVLAKRPPGNARERLQLARAYHVLGCARCGLCQWPAAADALKAARKHYNEYYRLTGNDDYLGS